MQQQWTISQLDCDVQPKVDFIQQPAMSSSVAGLRRSSKTLPKATLVSKIQSWSLFGGPLLIWFSTAFWIPVKPLHLRNTLSKLIRCTKNCNACSCHWSTESPILLLDNTRPHVIQPMLQKLNKLPQSFASFVIGMWSLSNWLPRLQISKFFCREIASTTSRRQKMLLESLLNPETWIFMLENKQTYF